MAGPRTTPGPDRRPDPFAHERPDATRPEEWEWQHVTHRGATVLVSKVGGGTLGRRYVGAWHYSYSRRDFHEEGSDLDVGTPITHEEAAGLVADFTEYDDGDAI